MVEAADRDLGFRLPRDRISGMRVKQKRKRKFLAYVTVTSLPLREAFGSLQLAEIL
jgi:hypothetical protein